ncbi:hypothetical protein CSUI_005071 [Cystoisospora suis]|uniref:Uncharacterized protein n=1 Tax=Cystoisospora suis TaxID=483139 RepID=A0A2C6KWH1_9APIC|nr:hypothetical protein CSUI_005071 [Cystoisospora suis]
MLKPHSSTTSKQLSSGASVFSADGRLSLCDLLSFLPGGPAVYRK